MINKVILSLTTLYHFSTAQWIPDIPVVLPEIPVVLPEIPAVVPELPAVVPGVPSTTTTHSLTLPALSTTTLAPLPAGFFYGAYGQVCGAPSPSTQCPNTLSSAFDTPSGFMRCDRNHDCCLCESVTCNNCQIFSAGMQGVYGVKNININGRNPDNGGAEISCLGVESCAESVIYGKHIKVITASGVNSVKNAQIIINEPVSYFQIDCSAMGGCEGLDLQLVFEGPPPAFACGASLAFMEPFLISGIYCSAQDSCKNMKITIENNGCQRVTIKDLHCTGDGSCTNAALNVIGDVVIENCDLGPSGATMTGVDTCYHNLRQIYCPDPQACMGQTVTLTNPIQGFAMKCGGIASCAGSTWTLELNYPYGSASMGNVGGAAEHLDGFWFTGPSSASQATIIIENRQGGRPLVIERIECSAANSCAGTTFIIGVNVNVNDIECSRSDSCRGCTIKYFATDVGFPCDPTQV